MASYNHRKEFTEFLGVNLKADDISRNPLYASGGQDAIYGQRGQIEKRPGHQRKLSEGQDPITLDGYQLMKHIGIDEDTGEETEDILGILAGASVTRLRKMVKEFMTVTYSGGGTAGMELIYDTTAGDYVFNLYENGSNVLNSVLGSKLLTTLETEIDAVANFAASTPAGNRASYAQITPLLDITSSPGRLFYYNTEAVDDAAAEPTDTISSFDDTWRNRSHTNVNGVMYWCDGDNNIYKYDGHYYYGAGMPKPSVSLAEANAGGLGQLAVGETYTFAVRFKFIDYAGNIHYSAPTFVTHTIVGSLNNVIDLTVTHPAAATLYPNLLLVETTAPGASTTTIPTTATAGQFKVGDKIAIPDTSTNKEIQYTTINTVNANSLVVDDAVTFATGQAVTHRYNFEVYRSFETGGNPNEAGPFFAQGLGTPIMGGLGAGAVRSFENDAAMASQATLDVSRVWSEGVPQGSIVANFQNSLVIAGDPENPGLVHFADQEGQEQFDLSVNNFIVNGSITGIGTTKEQLAVFKKTNTDVVTGDLQGFNIRVDRADDDTGCLSHESIKTIDEGVLFWLSDKGPWQMSNGVLGPLGGHAMKSGKQVSRIEPYFVEPTPILSINDPAEDNTQYKTFKRATAGHWSKKNLYVLFIPHELRDAPARGQDESICWVFDYEKGTWLPQWTNIIADCGFAEKDGEFFFLKRTNNSGQASTAQFNTTNSIYDYTDEGTAISFQYKPGWMHFDMPSIFKKFIRVNVFAHESIQNATYDLDLKSEINFNEGTYLTDISDASVTIGENRKFKLNGMKSRAARLIFENNTKNENVSINGWSVEYTANYRGAIKE